MNNLSSDIPKKGSERFVLVPPMIHLKDKKLKYLDALVYTSLKSFNSQFAQEAMFTPKEKYGEGCYPALTTICKQSGLAKATVVASLKRLESAKMITTTRFGKVKVANHYWFPDLDQSYTIPFSIFQADDLSANEKAMLICLRQFYIGEELTCMFTNTITEIAKHLGLSYRTVHAQYQSLVAKGYVVDETQPYKNDYNRRLLQLSSKLKWVFKPKPAIDYTQVKLVISGSSISFEGNVDENQPSHP